MTENYTYIYTMRILDVDEYLLVLKYLIGILFTFIFIILIIRLFHHKQVYRSIKQYFQNKIYSNFIIIHS